MIIQVLHCPNCHGTAIVRQGKTRQGKQRSRCREQDCAGRTCLLEYAYAGQSPAVKQQIVDMAMNASGIRDTARVLHISPNTVLAELKKGPCAGASEPRGAASAASRTRGSGNLPRRGAGLPSRTDLRTGRNVELRAQQSEPAVVVARD
jgi:transposase-like protein